MAEFAIQAIDSGGTLHNSITAGVSKSIVRTELERRGLIVISVRDARRRSRTRLRQSDKLRFTGSMAALLNAGMPLIPSLRESAAVVPRGSATVDAVRNAVERGESLAGAMRGHPASFEGSYTAVIAAGEESGTLAESFERLQKHLEDAAALRSRIISAAIYPAILTVTSILATAFLVGYVLPRFTSVLADTGIALPRSTDLLLRISKAAQDEWRVIAIGMTVTACACYLVSKTEQGRKTLARLQLVLPVVGDVRRQVHASQFAALTSVMLRGGVPLVHALDETARALSDPIARKEIDAASARVQSGSPLHDALQPSVAFSPLLLQLIGIGERSGRLAEFLARAAQLSAQRAERTLSRLVTLAEPAMILGFGLIVGFVAVSLLQAVYSVNGTALR